MSPPDGSPPPPADPAPPSTPTPSTPPAPSGSPAAASPTSGRFAELLAGIAPPERIERLAVLETLTYGTLYEGRVFRASRAEPVALLAVDRTLESGSAYPPILRNLLAASRIHGNHVLAPRGLYRDAEELYALYDAQAGLSLATAFEHLQRTGLRLSSEAVLRIASGVLQALDEIDRDDGSALPGAPRFRCHGLLIPENLFATADQRVLVRGLGIWQSDLAKLGRLGPKERRYIAPQQSSSGAASARNDLISLGAILFEAAAGFPAFDSPPSEDDLAELVVRIDEIGAKAEDARRDLFGIAHACLSAMAVTSASRSRLRITVDTMFLRESAKDRVPGCVSLEELAGRVKAARPAIVKAVALELDPVDALPRPAPPPVPSTADAADAPDGLSPAPGAESSGEPVDGPAGSGPVPVASPPEPTWLRPSPAPTPASQLRFEIHMTRTTAIRLLAGAGVLVLAGVIFWISRPQPAHRPEESAAAAVAEPVAVGESASASAAAQTGQSGPTGEAEGTNAPAPTPDAAAESAGQREAALAQPVAPATGARSEPPPAAPPKASRGARAPDPRAARSPRTPPRGRVAPGGPPPSASEASRPAEAQAAAAPAVAPGTLVSASTPGLVAPVVSERPEDPRFSPGDPRPASPGTVQLQILVDEHGRVLDHRILGATRFPTGITSGVAGYLSHLRFQPAELGGVPVRVWIRHDMRFLAP